MKSKFSNSARHGLEHCISSSSFCKWKFPFLSILRIDEEHGITFLEHSSDDLVLFFLKVNDRIQRNSVVNIVMSNYTLATLIEIGNLQEKLNPCKDVRHAKTARGYAIERTGKKILGCIISKGVL